MNCCKKILTILLCVIFFVTCYGCADNVNHGHENNPVFSDNTGFNSVDTEDTDAIADDTDSDTQANDGKNIEKNPWEAFQFNTIFQNNEYMRIYYAISHENAIKLNEVNKHFNGDIASGALPGTFTYEYNGTEYQLPLISKKYDNSMLGFCPTVIYRNPEKGLKGIEVIVDVQTMGKEYMEVRIRDENLFVARANEYGEDELIEIVKEYFLPSFDANGLTNEDYFVQTYPYQDYQIENGETRRYRIEFRTTGECPKKEVIATAVIDVYGNIRSSHFSNEMLYDDEFVSRLPDVDYDSIRKDIEAFREEKCDCKLSISTRFERRVLNGHEMALLVIFIVPEDRDNADHYHDYNNEPLFMLFELKQ